MATFSSSNLVRVFEFLATPPSNNAIGLAYTVPEGRYARITFQGVTNPSGGASLQARIRNKLGLITFTFNSAPSSGVSSSPFYIGSSRLEINTTIATTIPPQSYFLVEEYAYI